MVLEHVLLNAKTALLVAQQLHDQGQVHALTCISGATEQLDSQLCLHRAQIRSVERQLGEPRHAYTVCNGQFCNADQVGGIRPHRKLRKWKQ